MSEVKGNSNSGDSTGLLHPVVTSVSNSHITKNIGKPLETNAQALHPLSQKQSVVVSSQPITIESSNMQFNSATGSKNSQKVNLFAEQNAKLAKKKQKQKKNKRIAIIISSAVGVLVVAGIIMWLLIIASSSNNQIDEPEVPIVIFGQDSVTEAMSELQKVALEAYQPKAEISPEGTTSLSGTLSSAEQVFDKAQSASQNQDYLSQIIVSKIIFYVNNGYYNLAIDNIGNVNIDQLTPEQRITFYNFISIAYYNADDKEKSNDYTRLAQGEAVKLGGVGE